MGLEAECAARYGRQSGSGTARLEDKSLTFRGDFSFAIPLKDVRSVEARRGLLTLNLERQRVSFRLGAAAEKWALKIRYPRSLLDKLGVRPDDQVVLLGVTDTGFLRQLEGRTSRVFTRPRRHTDLILLGAEEIRTLGRLKRLEGFIKKTGAIWVFWPKGRKQLTENDVRAAGTAAGLVDTKVVSFSETHSGLKLMIPRARR